MNSFYVLRAAASLGALLALGTATLASAQTELTSDSAPSAAAKFQIVSRTPSSRVWQKVAQTTDPSATAQAKTNTYTELSDGLCVMSNGVLKDCAPRISLVADGATTSGTQHSVHWSANAANAEGVVNVTTWNGVSYRTRVAGLSVWDPDTDANVMVAEIQDAQGVLYESNKVVYPNCFKGLVADLSYDFTYNSVEQNVMLRSQVPTPDALRLGTNCYLQVWTRFLDNPAPTPTTRDAGPVEDNAFLWFNGMHVGVGQALFVTNTDGAVISAGNVLKQWITDSNGATYLVEEIP